MSDIVRVEISLDIAAQVELSTTVPDGFAFGTAVERAIDIVAKQMRHRFYGEQGEIGAHIRDPLDSRIEARISLVELETKSVRAFALGRGDMDK